jgi:hypothetical protein
MPLEYTAAQKDRPSDPPTTANQKQFIPPLQNQQSSNFNPKLLAGGIKFCNTCGTLLKKKDKSYKCCKCHAIFHGKCLKNKFSGNVDNFVCDDC